MAIWNCNGSMKLGVGAFEDSFKDRDIIFYSKTHQALGGTLPKVSGYNWEKTCRREVRSECKGRGSRGVAVLFKEELQPIIHIIRRDAQARYMWIKIKAETGRPLYIAICYFPPSTSHYASPKGQSPYTILEDLWEFSKDGEVILLGDFNARTGNSQASFYDTSEEMLRELDTSDLSLARRYSQDEECTRYGRHLLELGTTHGLAILNGLQNF